MTLVKRTLDNLFPSFFNNFFSRDWKDWSNSNFWSTNSTLPAANVLENDKEYTIEVAAPGLNKEDFNIKLDDNQLRISSESKKENETRNSRYYRKEYSYQSFQRSFQLPENLVNGNKISAEYKVGILSIHLPKKEESKPKPSRIISIS